MVPQFTISRAIVCLKSRHYIAAGSLLIFCIYFFSTFGLSRSIITGSTSIELYSSSNHDIQKINNATLGFGQIYALNLPARTDKHDSLDLAATLSNLTLSWRDGINGSTMHPNAVPSAHFGDGELTKDAEIGCWRGHMNILREVAISGTGSALILEDDADWDIHIHSQMKALAIAVRETTSLLPEAKRSCHGDGDSPYGSCWDILWIGHCGGWAPNIQNHDFYSVIREDSTVPPVFDMEELTTDVKQPCAAHVGRKLKDDVVCESPELNLDERIVQYKASPICTTGYAVSRQGARKILARMGAISLADVDANLDTELTELCRGDADTNNREPFQCLSIAPPLILSHRPRGKKAGDSDINGGKGEREIGITRGAVFSTRLNIEALIKGETPQSQYVRDESGKWRHKLLKEYRIS